MSTAPQQTSTPTASAEPVLNGLINEYMRAA